MVNYLNLQANYIPVVCTDMETDDAKLFAIFSIVYYPVIDYNEVDMRIYLPEKVIFTEAPRPIFYHLNLNSLLDA